MKRILAFLALASCGFAGTWVVSPGKGSHAAAGGGASFAEVQQVNLTSTASSTTHTVNFTAATAGNLLVLCWVADDYTGTLPSGYTNATGTTAQDFTGTYIMYKVATGGETSAVITLPSSTSCAATLFEFSGMDAVTPNDKNAAATGQGSGTTAVSCGTTAATVQANELIVALVGISSAGSGSGSNVASWSNSLVEQADSLTTGSGTNVTRAVAWKTVSATGTQTTTATMDLDSGNSSGTISTFKITTP